MEYTVITFLYEKKKFTVFLGCFLYWLLVYECGGSDRGGRFFSIAEK